MHGAGLIAAGLGLNGVSLDRAWAGVWPLFALGLGSACRVLLVPMALPLIPFRPFWLKGWLAGAAVTAALLHGAGLGPGHGSRIPRRLLAVLPRGERRPRPPFCGGNAGQVVPPVREARSAAHGPFSRQPLC